MHTHSSKRKKESAMDGSSKLRPQRTPIGYVSQFIYVVSGKAVGGLSSFCAISHYYTG